MDEMLATIPDHVRPELVHDFDLYALGVEMLANPFRHSEILDQQGAPDIFFTPRHGGHWVFRRYDDVLAGFADTDRFTAGGVNIPPMANQPILMPQGIDPPDHARYRRLLNPLFAPTAIRRINDWITRFAAELIDGFAERGECDFVADFSSKLPTSVFLKLMGMPIEDLPLYMTLEHDMFRGPPEGRIGAYMQVYQHLDQLYAQKSRHPGDDVPSALLAARDEDGNPFSIEELRGMGLLLFLAGLDTVTNTMSAIWHSLATDDALRGRMVAEPGQRTDALDELLRVHSVPNLPRKAKRDLDYKGVTIMAGDRILLMAHRANRDHAHFENPEDMILERRPRDMLTFGWGAHRCVGSLLARNEIRTALDEWLRRIPEFRVRRGDTPEAFAGLVMGYHRLPLEWDRAHPR